MPRTVANALDPVRFPDGNSKKKPRKRKVGILQKKKIDTGAVAAMARLDKSKRRGRPKVTPLKKALARIEELEIELKISFENLNMIKSLRIASVGALETMRRQRDDLLRMLHEVVDDEPLASLKSKWAVRRDTDDKLVASWEDGEQN
jgi:hypothetical protein